jgi:sugar lactone lactonase YvrE
VPGLPVGANIRDDNLIIANAGNQAVEQLNMVSGNVSTVFDGVTGGGVLGTANHPVIDQAGNIYVSNREGGQVFRYDMEEDTVSVFLEGLLNPNALAFGPEGSNVLYVGTLGTVWRVSVEARGVAGTPIPYLELGPDVDITYEVDGIAFDEGQNMWVGCPNAETLYVARYVGAEATTAIREWAMTGAGYSYFVNTTMGRGDFGGSLYWTNLSGSTVGRLRVGLGRL